MNVYRGNIVHSKSFNDFEIIVDGFLAVQDGNIAGIGKDYSLFEHSLKNTATVTVLPFSQFLIPGFVDCHIHAPQMPNIGLGLDKPLLEWLDAYTFPLESEYKNDGFAQKVYEQVVRDTIRNGTTFACYFATIYKNSTKILADEVERQGQRAYIGKVSSNTSSPDFYIEESTEVSINDNVEVIEYVLGKKNVLVKPIITPRFALTCDMDLMKKLGELAEKYNLPIQSHISENLGEIEAVKDVFPTSSNYADVYDQAKLLTNKCVMAHGVHLEDKEIELLNARGTSIAHCPLSNTCLSSGLCDVKRLIAGGVKVGLGTDVSGGNRVGILEVIRAALVSSQHICIAKTQLIKGTGKIPDSTGDNAKYTPIDYKQAIYLATLGGAETLHLDDKIGNFVVGKAFDALLIETDALPIIKYELPDSINKVKSAENKFLELVQKFVYVGDDRNISKVFVKGREVKS